MVKTIDNTIEISGDNDLHLLAKFTLIPREHGLVWIQRATEILEIRLQI